MRRALDALYTASGWAAALCIVAICAVVSAQVVLNTLDKIRAGLGMVPLGLTIPSYSTFTGFFLAAASFLALAATLKAGGHIRVTLLTGRLAAGPARALEGLALAMGAAAAAFFAWHAAMLTWDSWRFGDMSPGLLALPIWPPQAAMALGLAVLTIALVDELAAVLRGRPPSYAGKGEELLSPSAKGD